MCRRNKLAACLIASALALQTVPAYAGNAPIPLSAILMTNEDTYMTKGAAATYLRYMQAETYERYTMYYNIYERDIGQFWSAKNSDGKTNSQLLKDTVKDDLKIIAASNDHAKDYGITVSESEKKDIAKNAKLFIEQTDEGALKDNEITKEDVEQFFTMELIREKVKAQVVKDTDRKVSTKEKQQCSISYFTISASAAGKDETDESLNKALSGENAKSFYEKTLKKAENSQESTATFSYYSFVSDYTSGNTSLPLAVMKAAAKLKDGEYAAVKTDNSTWCFIRMDKTYDREATNNKEKEIVLQRADELFENQAEEWIKNAGIRFNDQLWHELGVNDTVVYQPYEEGEGDLSGQTEGSAENATENTTENTTETEK